MHGAIFDMDGLLIDSEKLFQRTWREMAAEVGVTLDEAFPAAICGSSGAATEEVLRRYLPMVEPKPFIAECNRRVRELEEREIPMKPGVFEILAGMKNAGCRMALASSSPADMIRHALRLTGMEEYFDQVISGRTVENGKPAPDIFLKAAAALGLDPADCFVFEDSLNGVRAGLNAGCATVMIPDLAPPTAELRERCFGIYPDLSAAWREIAAGSLLTGPDSLL